MLFISFSLIPLSRVGFGIEIFYFGQDRKIPKIPKSRRSGSGSENPEKIASEKSRFSGHRDFQIPGIRDFYPWASGFFLILGFLYPWFGIFSGSFYLRDIPGIYFIPGIGIFFVGWDFPTKSQLCLLVTNSERFWLHQIRLCNLQHWIKDFATSYWRRGLNVA